MTRSRATVERASAGDLLQRVTDVGPAPMQVGAVLVLDGPVDLVAVRRAVDRRTRAMPRLRQRLLDAPMGLGRPYWVDDGGFAVEHHVRGVACPPPGDEAALLAVAADLATQRLPADRPLWAVTLVTDLEGGASALVPVFHHVVADGVGGLAVLAGLVDGAAEDLAVPAVRPPPGRAALLADAARTRLHGLATLPASARRLLAAARDLRRADTPRAARRSLNRPVGPDRSLAVARVDLASVVETAHRQGATVNDVVLAAVAGALQAAVRRRGEAPVAEFVVSVPVSGRKEAGAADLGNDVGVRPVAVPAVGAPHDRLADLVRLRRDRPAAPSSTSQAVLGPVFRFLAWVGLFRWFTEHQRLVHTFVTNLRGPDRPLTFLGVEVREVVPVSGIAGNVTVAFAVLSYAGTLAVTVIADTDAWPDLDELRHDLQAELDALVLLPSGA